MNLDLFGKRLQMLSLNRPKLTILNSSILKTYYFLIISVLNFCRIARVFLGYPLKPLFQGHAWWHLLAGIGTNTAILFRYVIDSIYFANEPYLSSDTAVLLICMWYMWTVSGRYLEAMYGQFIYPIIKGFNVINHVMI